jgi:hypothetical protein
MGVSTISSSSRRSTRRGSGASFAGRGVCGPVVVDEVLAQEAAQMGFVQHHDVVEALAAEGADEPFHGGILPRRPRRRLDFILNPA